MSVEVERTLEEHIVLIADLLVRIQHQMRARFDRDVRKHGSRRGRTDFARFNHKVAPQAHLRSRDDERAEAGLANRTLGRTQGQRLPFGDIDHASRRSIQHDIRQVSHKRHTRTDQVELASARERRLGKIDLCRTTHRHLALRVDCERIGRRHIRLRGDHEAAAVLHGHRGRRADLINVINTRRRAVQHDIAFGETTEQCAGGRFRIGRQIHLRTHPTVQRDGRTRNRHVQVAQQGVCRAECHRVRPRHGERAGVRTRETAQQSHRGLRRGQRGIPIKQEIVRQFGDAGGQSHGTVFRETKRARPQRVIRRHRQPTALERKRRTGRRAQGRRDRTRSRIGERRTRGNEDILQHEITVGVRTEAERARSAENQMRAVRRFKGGHPLCRPFEIDKRDDGLSGLALPDHGRRRGQCTISAQTHRQRILVGKGPVARHPGPARVRVDRVEADAAGLAQQKQIALANNRRVNLEHPQTACTQGTRTVQRDAARGTNLHRPIPVRMGECGAIAQNDGVRLV